MADSQTTQEAADPQSGLADHSMPDRAENLGAMNASEPSFFRMFRRSRYLRPVDPDDPDGKSRMRQVERFAASAVGFCLKHDKDFCQKFLRHICDADPQKATRTLIEVEPEHCADLRLVTTVNDRHRVYVIEFKIAADLESKQDPSAAAFGLPDGYGSLLQRSYGSDEGRYIIVCRPNQLAGSGYYGESKICWKTRTWADIEACCSADRPLTVDLVSSLAQLGVKEFLMREIKNITVATFGDAVNAVKIVQALQKDSLGGVWKEDIVSPSAGHLNIGAYLNSPDGRGKPVDADSLAGQLRSCFGSTGKEIAWFGYESGVGVPGGFSTSAWLYCRTTNRAQRVTEKIAKALGRDVEVDEPQEDAPDVCAVARKPRFSKTSDVDWFLKVLNAALNRKP